MHEATLEHRFSGENTFATLRYLLSEEKRNFLLAVIFFAIKHSPAWILPLLTANLIDDLIQKKSVTSVVINASLFVFVVLQNFPTNLLYVKFLSRGIRNIENDLRSSLVERLQQLSMGFFHRTNAGLIQSKVIRDVENIEQMLRHMSDGGQAAINGIIGCLVISAIKVPQFLPFFLVLVPLSAIFIIRMRSTANQRNDAFRAEIEKMSNNVNEMTTLIPVTRAHALEADALETMYRSFSNVRRAGLSLDAFNAKFNAGSWVLFQMANAICLIFAIYCAWTGFIEISTGEVVLLSSYFGQLIGSVILLSSLMPLISKGLNSVKSLGSVLESPDIEENQGKTELSQVNGVITFNQVNFKYKVANSLAIDSINVSAKPGDLIALVGSSGSGKSTFINLVIGFLKPSHGSIQLDGFSLQDVDLRSVRKFISVVPQESILFDGTIKENIAYGLKGVTDQDLNKALSDANALGFVNQLPEGVNTLVGDRGAKLSGGQKQRLAIARALIRNPKILILDEATSALDSESEHLIQKSIAEILKNKTTFVVAHRLSTVKNATKILVLDHGRIVEQGTHAELLQQNGQYANLYSHQLIED
ncbi:MAG: ABC transporter ATP-binding protein [Candidatus Nanopelagicaceae bacterium]